MKGRQKVPLMKAATDCVVERKEGAQMAAKSEGESSIVVSVKGVELSAAALSNKTPIYNGPLFLALDFFGEVGVGVCVYVCVCICVCVRLRFIMPSFQLLCFVAGWVLVWVCTCMCACVCAIYNGPLILALDFFGEVGVFVGVDVCVVCVCVCGSTPFAYTRAQTRADTRFHTHAHTHMPIHTHACKHA